jgi:diguanylate cyclase (GGDEF)-like protein/PAS domain S-box-containing protein
MPETSQPRLFDTAHLKALFDAVPDGIYLLDPVSSNVLFCNRAAYDDLGYAADEILGHSVLSLQKDVTGLPAWEQIAAEIRKASPFVFVGRHRHKDGHEVSVEVCTNTFYLNGTEYFLSSARNISLRVMQEAAMLERDAHVRFALNEASDGLWDWNVATHEVFFSPQLKRMLGYGPHEMTPTLESWSANVHADDKERVFLVLQQHLRGQRERYDVQYRLKNRNGHYLWVNDRGRVCERDAQGKPLRVVGMVQNITDQKTLELQLMRQASHDSLTGLRNRGDSEATLLNLVNTCRRLDVPLGVCMFDLDYFKNINDVHGHLIGDQVLVRVAERMSGLVRSTDSLFRWGGEEFLLLCPGTGADALEQLLHKLRDELSCGEWSDLVGTDPVTASFGVAIMPAHGDTPGALLLAADTALYRAKAAGRNQVVMATAQDCAPTDLPSAAA